jgi:hypothetical protein
VLKISVDMGVAHLFYKRSWNIVASKHSTGYKASCRTIAFYAENFLQDTKYPVEIDFCCLMVAFDVEMVGEGCFVVDINN